MKTTGLHISTTLSALKEYRWIFQPNIRNVERLDDTGETINVQWLNPTEQRTTVTHYVLEVKPKYPDETSSNTRIEIPAPHSSHVVTGINIFRYLS